MELSVAAYYGEADYEEYNAPKHQTSGALEHKNLLLSLYLLTQFLQTIINII